MANARKRVMAIAREAEAEGWRVRETTSGVVLYSPDGETTVSTHFTPSDPRSLRNFVAALRRAGLDEGRRWRPW